MDCGSSATFSWNSLCAPAQTGADCRSLSCSRLGRRAELKASLASRGSRLGRWSMEMTLRGGPALVSTATTGSEKVVLMV